MTFLSMQVRSDAPSVDQQHVRRKVMDFDRVGLPIVFYGVCECGWNGPQRQPNGYMFVGDLVDRDLHAHIVAMREAAK